MQTGISFFIFLGGCTIAQLLPIFFTRKLGGELNSAQWVIVFLGASLGVDQASGTFRGIITGCHRWDIHNVLNVLTRFGSFLGMLFAILVCGGLREMAIAYFLAVLIFGVLRAYVAKRVCSEFRISVRYANRYQARQMIYFGWKSFILDIPPLIVIQSANVLLTGVAGPAALAVFVRSMTLVLRFI